MIAFLLKTLARGFAQLINATGAPRLMPAIVWAALVVLASEAAAQLPARDTSANAIINRHFFARQAS